MSARAEAAATTGERLLAAAWQQFATRPYEDVRLSEIAADAGVTVQTLHIRFGSKERLLAAAYGWFGQREMARRDAAPVGQLEEAVGVLFGRYETSGDAVLRMLAQEERNPAIRQMTDAGRAYHRAWAERTFAPLLQSSGAGTRRRRLAAIVIATDLLVWKLLRRDMQLEREEAERIMVEMVKSSAPAG